jgi:hypothetical protein
VVCEEHQSCFLQDTHFWIACLAKHFKSPTYLPTAVGNWCIIVNVRHLYTICKHKLAKIVEPLALFMLFLNNERESTQHLVAGASQHVVEKVCGVGVGVGTF